MRARIVLSMLAVALALGADGGDQEKKAKAAKTSPAPAWKPPTPGPVDPQAEVLAFVNEHHPELGKVLASLKCRDQAKYRKAIGELSTVARNLADLKARNSQRYEL